jgi:hypothetical protein
VLLLTGGNGFVSLAERHVPAGLAALVVASVPLWLLLIRTVAGDRPVRATLVGLAVGFLGVGLLVVRGGHDQCVSIPHLLIVLGASLSWALGSWASSRLPMPSDAATGTAVEMLIGGVVLGALGRSRDPGGVRPDSGSDKVEVGDGPPTSDSPGGLSEMPITATLWMRGWPSCGRHRSAWRRPGLRVRVEPPSQDDALGASGPRPPNRSSKRPSNDKTLQKRCN